MASPATARRDPSRRWLTAALLVTAAASLVLLLAPLVESVEMTPTGGRAERHNLLSLEGWRAVVIVGVPVLLAAIPLALPRGARWPGTALVTFVMTAGVVLAILTVGVFYLPTVILLIAAMLRSDSVPA